MVYFVNTVHGASGMTDPQLLEKFLSPEKDPNAAARQLHALCYGRPDEVVHRVSTDQHRPWSVVVATAAA